MEEGAPIWNSLRDIVWARMVLSLEIHSLSLHYCLGHSRHFPQHIFCRSELFFIAAEHLLFLLLVLSKVSYLLEGGSMAHEDFCGHVGQMNPGDLQVWPTANNC